MLSQVDRSMRREPEAKLATTTVSDLRGTLLAGNEPGWRDYRRWLALLLGTVSVLWFVLR